ncbi:GNAT family N-acetyltransferase [Yoonia sp. R2331]|uniref:GNAT family N-acetyltransferase n=1 Tax=Yoonia sp. R2331 TaxID=3237238 RepID=UPI0034E3D2DD
MTATLRHARVEDAIPCARILGAWFTATEWVPRLHSPPEDLQFLRKLIGGGLVTVADIRGIAVGYLARDGADLMHLYVDHDHRRQGIGTQLLHAAQRTSGHLHLWCFQANTGARRFYERHGFTATDETDGADNEEGLPDLRYEWRAPT